MNMVSPYLVVSVCHWLLPWPRGPVLRDARDDQRRPLVPAVYRTFFRRDPLLDKQIKFLVSTLLRKILCQNRMVGRFRIFCEISVFLSSNSNKFVSSQVAT